MGPHKSNGKFIENTLKKKRYKKLKINCILLYVITELLLTRENYEHMFAVHRCPHLHLKTYMQKVQMLNEQCREHFSFVF